MNPEIPPPPGRWEKFLRAIGFEGKPGIPPNPQDPPTPSVETIVQPVSPPELDLPDVVDREQQLVLPTHPAYEFIGNVRFTKHFLSSNREFSQVLVEILKNAQPQRQHDRAWLENKADQLNQISFEGAADSDQDGVKTLHDRFIEMAKKAVGEDERLLKAQEHAKEVMKGNRPTDIDYSGLNEALNDLGDENLANNVRTIMQHITMDQNQMTKEQYEIVQREYAGLINGIQESKRQLSKSVDQTNQTSLKSYSEQWQKYDKALSEVAKIYVETHPSEGGRFYDALKQQGGMESMQKVLESDPRYRDYWFYKIMEPILYNQRLESHRELYSLQSINDMELFLSLIGRMKNEANQHIGKEMVGYYTMLKNTIFQAHDMDFFAAHPQQDIKEFIGSTAQFTNQYISFAMQDPMVSMAKRMYEVALLQLREDNNGYIPRTDLAWRKGRMNIELDRRVEKLLKISIQNGQLYDVERDPITGGFKLDRFGEVLQGKDKLQKVTLTDLYGGEPALSEHWKRDSGDLQIAAALKMAKGLALVDQRLLEIIGRSKGAGSGMSSKKPDDNYSFGGSGFNSAPYEGIVKHIEPVIHEMTRFGAGGQTHLPWFNVFITDNPHLDWKPEKLQRLIQLHQDGDTDTLIEEFGEAVNTRLMTIDNPFSFSGMWGTMTKWRVKDQEVRKDDWDKERYSTAHKLSFIGDSFIRTEDPTSTSDGKKYRRRNRFNEYGWARDKVQDHFKFDDNSYKGSDNKTSRQFLEELKQDYRERLIQKGEWYNLQLEPDNPENPKTLIERQNEAFEKMWLYTGKNQLISEEHAKIKGWIASASDGASVSYESLINKHFDDVKAKYKDDYGRSLEDHMKILTYKTERAYKSRIWVQATMRSPLIVAREWQTDYDIHGYKRKGPLRKKIIQELLNIDIDQFAHDGEPTENERIQRERILDIEGAISSISQISIRENRDLRDKDFDNIGSETPNADTDPVVQQKRKLAKEYWHMVQQAMLGDTIENNENLAQEWYQALGIQDADAKKAEGLRFHRINYDTIEKNIRYDNQHGRIDGQKGKYKQDITIFNDNCNFKYAYSELMNARNVDRDWRSLFSSEDMGWEYLTVLAAGERSPIRRAGDLGAHVAFNGGLGQMFDAVMKTKLDREKFIEGCKEMFVNLCGDDGNVAYDSIGRVFYSTLKMYQKADWAWKIPWFGPLFGMLKSASVMEMINGGPFFAESLGPNDIMQLIHAGVTERFILPSAPYPFTSDPQFGWSGWDERTMSEALHASTGAAFYELGTKAAAIALAVTILAAIKEGWEDRDSN